MSEPVLIFSIGGERMAIDCARVREVIAAPPVTPVPSAPEGVVGAAAIRGAIVPVVDLFSLLGLSPRAARAGDLLLLLDGAAPAGNVEQSVRAAIAVDAVHGISEAGAEGAAVPGGTCIDSARLLGDLTRRFAAHAKRRAPRRTPQGEGA